MTAWQRGLVFERANPSVAWRVGGPDAIVAVFRTADGSRLEVRRRHLTPFDDIRLSEWPKALRPQLIEALCRPVTEAPVIDGALDLSARFGVQPDHDAVEWQITGFRQLFNADLHLVKHVLGAADPTEHAAWEQLLGQSIDRAWLLGVLDTAGATDWRLLGDETKIVQLYRRLTPPDKLACIRALGPLREAYMRATQDAIRGAGLIHCSRHIHYGSAGKAGLDLLDDRGVWVSAKGRAEDFAIATAFCCRADGEDKVGPLTLDRRRRRIRRTLAHERDVVVHTPVAWGF